MGSGKQIILSGTPNKERVLSVFASDDGSYVYFTALDQDSSSPLLLRVGLTSLAQNFPKYYSALSTVFPVQTADCNIEYSVFKQAFIIISGWRDQSACYDTAKSRLQRYDLPLSGFSIVFASSNSYSE